MPEDWKIVVPIYKKEFNREKKWLLNKKLIDESLEQDLILENYQSEIEMSEDSKNQTELLNKVKKIATNENQKEAKKKFECPHCNYTTSRNSNFKRHSLKHSGDRPFKCSLCYYTCSRKQV
ncbi:Zinc finger protein [Armadillidium vulgare]|nr:Zinc finger protein [Armadillidium vulgare]